MSGVWLKVYMQSTLWYHCVYVKQLAVVMPRTIALWLVLYPNTTWQMDGSMECVCIHIYTYVCVCVCVCKYGD
jgi:hypothetical protein